MSSAEYVASEIPEVTDHMDNPQPSRADFFVEFPPGIGELLSAYTSLATDKQPWSSTARWIFTGVGAVILGVPTAWISYEASDGSWGWAMLLFLVGLGIGALIGWAVTRFHHTITYVGTEGMAKFCCTGNRDKISTMDVFQFETATELRTAVTSHYTNGVYTHTAYTFTWEDDGGATQYLVNGTYNENKPKPGDEYLFGRVGEGAWSQFLFDRADETLERDGFLHFNISGNDWVRVGSGFIDLHFKNETVHCEREEIEGMTVQSGTFTIKRTDAREGWFSSEGVFSFECGKMANLRLFLVALEALLGYSFDE